MPAPTSEQIKNHTDSLENMPGQEFDEEKTTTIFAEDLRGLSTRITELDETKLTAYGDDHNEISVKTIHATGIEGVTLDADVTFTQAPYLDSDPTTGRHATPREYVEEMITDAIDDAYTNLLENKIYPVGCLYFSASVSTNPGILLGFGTWTAFAEGRAIVGKATAGTFGTIGTTGGAETHSHDSGTYQAQAEIFTVSGRLYIDQKASNAVPYNANRRDSVSGSATSEVNGELQDQGINVDGSSGNASSLMPYIVVYIWRRTA